MTLGHSDVRLSVEWRKRKFHVIAGSRSPSVTAAGEIVDRRNIPIVISIYRGALGAGLAASVAVALGFECPSTVGLAVWAVKGAMEQRSGAGHLEVRVFSDAARLSSGVGRRVGRIIGKVSRIGGVGVGEEPRGVSCVPTTRRVGGSGRIVDLTFELVCRSRIASFDRGLGGRITVRFGHGWGGLECESDSPPTTRRGKAGRMRAAQCNG